MVLLPHGGPHAEGDGWAYDNDAQFLASRGYLVLQVNYRGSEGRGGAFERAGFRKWGTRVQDDLLDGIRWTIAQGYADPQRICAYGASFGAYSAMMVAVRAPELIRCAAGLSGLYDLEVFANDSDTANTDYGRSYITRVLGTDRKEWRANSPVNLAAQIKAPVFLAHGEIDERTPYSQAVEMKKALERAGRTPEWMSVPGEAHGFYKDENNVEFYKRLEAFLARNIGAGKAH
jgi:dipeptidyl aminopeptidase/acylaminoacyl peptidase